MNRIPLPASINSVINQFVYQWHQNVRFRWMVWSISYIIILYLALMLRDFQKLHADNLEQLQHKAARLQLLKSQTQWGERLAFEEAIGEKITSKLWSASTSSLAEADLQNALRSLLSTHNAQNIRLRLAPSDSIKIGGKSLIKVTVEVAGNLKVSDINHLFKAVADQTKHFYIDRMSYSAQGSGQITMYVTAYFLEVQVEEGTKGGESVAQ